MVEYHPYSDTILDDPYPTYARMRVEAPVYYVEEFNAHFLTRFEDIWKLCADNEHLSIAQGNTPGHILTRDTPVNPSLAGTDPPRHSKMRAFVNPHFLPKAAERMSEQIAPIVTRLMDELVERGEGDLVQDFAAQIAVRGAMLTAGLPLEHVDDAIGWVNGIFHRRDGHMGATEIGQAAGLEMFKFCHGHVQEMKKNPEKATGLLRTMIEGELDGAKMTDFEMAAALGVILIGGSDTFPKVFAATLKNLSDNPEQRQQCIDDPALVSDAFVEALRRETPTQFLGRICTKSFQVRDVTIEPGQGVLFCWAAANRDEAEFENPEAFDLHRHPKRMLGFGHGTHMCIGHHIAKMEARLGLQEIMRRIPNYEIDLAKARRNRTEFVQGWVELPATFGT